MKRLLALLLVLMMLVPTALGEEEIHETVFEWEKLISVPELQALAENEGTFATLERYGLSMWLPYGLQRTESETYIYDLAMEDGAYRFMVGEDPLPENITTAAELVEYLETKAYDGRVSRMRVNGLLGFGLYLNEGDTAVIVFVIGDTAVQFFFPNQLDENMVTVYALMIGSIHDAEETQTAEE